MLYKRDKLLKPIIAIYCLAIYLSIIFLQNTPIVVGKDSQINKKSEHKEGLFFISDLTSNYQYHFEKLNQKKDFKKSFLKKKQEFTDYKGLTISQIICPADTYTNFSKILLVRFRKSDIIFPHHYFW